MTKVRRLNPQIAFLGLAVLVNLAAMLAVRAVSDPVRHRYAEFGAALDMTVTVTGLYYWMVVRSGLRPKSGLFVIAALGWLRASMALPGVVPGKAWIGPGVEVAVIAAIVVGWRRSRGVADPVERIRIGLAGLIPFPSAERVLAGEFAVLYYAFAWMAKPDVPAGARSFTLHKGSGIGDLMLLVGLASLLEVVPVHLVLAHWSVTAAWVMTGLSLYGALWVVALGRSIALRPVLVSADEILVRFGLLFSLRIPMECVKRMGRDAAPGAVVIPRNGTPNLFIGFTRPLEAERLFGFTKMVSAVGLCVDGDAGDWTCTNTTSR